MCGKEDGAMPNKWFDENTAGLIPSIGTGGDALDNALAETTIA
jgi:hypothetical protein